MGIKDDGRKAFRIWMYASQLVWTVVGAIVIFGALGYWIDRRTGQSPKFVVVGTLAGVAIGVYELFRGLARFEKLESGQRDGGP